MKHRTTISLTTACAALLLLVLTAAPAAQRGNGYGMSWRTVDGGGYAASADGHMLRGTVGQPDAHVLSGGGYTLAGGFWSGSPTETGYDVYLPLLIKRPSTHRAYD